MQGPRLKTLQNDGVQGWWDNTLQGACENGVASIGCRRRASALPANIKPVKTMTRKNTKRACMARDLETPG
jgi:hypothetical protein